MSIDALGVVLAGGASTRFGSDKCTAALAGIPIIERVITSLREILEEIVIVTAADRILNLSRFGTAIADDDPGRGPVGALATACAYSSRPYMIVMPCDMPFVTGDWLAGCFDRCTSEDSQVCVGIDNEDGLYPVCGCYSTSIESACQTLLLSKSASMHALFRTLKKPLTQKLPDSMRVNINTQADLEKAAREV